MDATEHDSGMEATREILDLLPESCPEALGRTVEALYRVHGLITAITDLDTLLTRITQESRHVANAEASSLLLFDESTQELHFHVATGASGDQDALKEQIRLKLGQGIAGAAAASKRSIIVPDVEHDDRFFSDADSTSQFKTRNLLAVPMIERGKLIGVLELVNKVGDEPFSDLDCKVTEIFSGIAATSIANARMIEERMRTERLAAVGEAVAGLSHYMKNIIAAMDTSAELITQGIGGEDLSLIGKGWQILRRGNHRISNCIQDMLSFSRVQPANRKDCELRELLHEVRQIFAEMCYRKQIDLAMSLDGLAAPVHVDPNGMYRCLLNILLNASDEVPDEGGEIHLTAWTEENGDTVIAIRDNGPGITDSDMAQIFDAFYTTKGSQGTGLGLAVTRKIMEEHNGTVTCANLPGGGAEFKLILYHT